MMPRLPMLALVAGLLLFEGAGVPREIRADATTDAFFAQSMQRLLERDVGPEASFLLISQEGTVLAARWPQADAPISPGSLFKPFAALAYGAEHSDRFPLLECLGAAGGCWRPAGHGPLHLSGAIANSCNAYFHSLVRELTARQVQMFAQSFGLAGPPPQAAGDELWGRSAAWKEPPLALLHAYQELAERRDLPGYREVIRGMRQSGQSGTGAKVRLETGGLLTLVKTGTAACAHQPHAPGDGFSVVLWPAEAPRYALLLRVHGVPGSQAAATAGHIVRLVERQADAR
jgi:hypothetical protein